MTSLINPAVIVDTQPVAKADLRTEFQIAANEITALQNVTAIPRRLIYEDALWDSL